MDEQKSTLAQLVAQRAQAQDELWALVKDGSESDVKLKAAEIAKMDVSIRTVEEVTGQTSSQTSKEGTETPAESLSTATQSMTNEGEGNTSTDGESGTEERSESVSVDSTSDEKRAESAETADGEFEEQTRNCSQGEQKETSQVTAAPAEEQSVRAVAIKSNENKEESTMAMVEETAARSTVTVSEGEIPVQHRAMNNYFKTGVVEKRADDSIIQTSDGVTDIQFSTEVINKIKELALRLIGLPKIVPAYARSKSSFCLKMYCPAPSLRSLTAPSVAFDMIQLALCK